MEVRSVRYGNGPQIPSSGFGGLLDITATLPLPWHALEPISRLVDRATKAFLRLPATFR